MLDSRTAIKIEIVEALGSTPRGVGTSMIVNHGEQLGTIGGGALEFSAIAQARELLQALDAELDATIVLGPEINQCCGGQVTLKYTMSDWPSGQKHPLKRENEVHIFGAGHTGAAIARQFSLLDWHVHIIDERAEWLAKLSSVENITCHREVLPERIVQTAAPNAYFIITTHSHDLDFAVTCAALQRSDTAYIGMIGSKTKRERFRRWAKMNGIIYPEERLNCPMGQKFLDVKTPEIIALSVAEEVVENSLITRKMSENG